ncbi:MAG TPA: hypothetical protein VK550_35060 [Polyangiaceae bacterium]|nr:hypothetical protein [Polyangiaceae bacterium]
MQLLALVTDTKSVARYLRAIGEDASASKATSNASERSKGELARKEEALAEAAAFLILKKKLDHYWVGVGDDTDEETEK